MHARVVVVKLAPHRGTLGFKQVADCVAQRGLSAVADMQRTGGVGRDKLDNRFLPGVCALAAISGALRQDAAHGLLLGSRLQADVDEPRPGDFHRIDPPRERRRCEQQAEQLLSHLARVLPQAFGQLHGSGAGQIAMRCHFG